MRLLCTNPHAKTYARSLGVFKSFPTSCWKLLACVFAGIKVGIQVDIELF